MSDITDGTVFSPMAKPRGTFALMAEYQAFKGLKPIGPHRPLADSLLKNVTRKCSTCDGTGLNGTYGGLGWRLCPTCHGMGEAYRISLDELRALRQQVLDVYPDAAPPDWKPGYPIPCPVLEIATNLIISACPRMIRAPVQGELFPDDGVGTAYLPRELCIRDVPRPQPAPRPPAQPRISWLGLRALIKLLWRRLNAYS